MVEDFRLKVFLSVAQTLSFTRSASMLCISQPAVSKHIREMEAAFGEALFFRRGNSIALTAKGREIIPLVEHILDGYDALSGSIATPENRYKGHLRIGASTTIEQYLLPEKLTKFTAKYKDIKLSVVSANSKEIVRLLEERIIDLGLVEDEGRSSSIHYTDFMEDEIVLVSRHKGTIELDSIPSLPLIIREEGSGTLSVILSALESVGITRSKLNIVMQLGSSEAISRYLLSSNAYAFISQRAVSDYISRGELVINNVDNFKITRHFRYCQLHGKASHLIDLFKNNL